MQTLQHSTQVLIIGTGLSGVTAALVLAKQGIEVTLICPTPLLDSGNSAMAQGGIIYSKTKEDQAALKNDIFIAGHQYNSPEAVDFLCSEGYKWVESLLINEAKVPFEKINNSWNYTREGGHSTARILHCHDYSGLAIMEALMKLVEKEPLITLLKNHTAIDLITIDHHVKTPQYRYQLQNQCLGAYILNNQANQVEMFLATHTILATGGIGQVYLHSTNSPFSVGSGISMAQRAGVRLMNMEYVQFHPTALFHVDSSRFLISEAMRGEGAILKNKEGFPFMEKYDPRKDLAPRDVVAQAIVHEMIKTSTDYVYLDTSSVKKNVETRFPTIFNHCKKIGINLHNNMIPVVPAAHYFCGGILVNQQGKSNLEGLYAIGECSCTGIHGKNRLASSSLLEALLWGASAAQNIAASKPEYIPNSIISAIPPWQNTGDDHNDDPVLIAQDWATIKHIMWNYVGIIRTQKRVKRAFNDLRDLSSHLHDFYKNTPISPPLIKLFHGCQTAYLITQSAMRGN